MNRSQNHRLDSEAAPKPGCRSAVRTAKSRLHWRPSSHWLALVCAVACGPLAYPNCLAAQTNGTWNVTTSGGTAGTNLWGTAGNWLGSTIATGTGATADFSQLTLAGNESVHLDSARPIGNLIFGDQANTHNWTLDNNGSPGNLLALAVTSGSPLITVKNGTAIINAILAGSSGLTASSGSELPLNGLLFYINNGASLSILDASPTLVLAPPSPENYTGVTSVASGTLLLDFSGLSAPANLLNSGSTLALSGGTLNINDKTGTAATLQTFSGTTLNAGGSAIQVTTNGNSNSASTLALGAIARSVGGTINFSLPATGSITTPTANAGGAILGGWATLTTVNSLTWAVSGGNGSTAGPISGLPAAGYTTDTLGATINTALTTSVNISSDTATNSIYLNTTSTTAAINDINSNNNVTLTINSGGLLMTPNVGPNMVNPVNYAGSNEFVQFLMTTGNAQKDLILNQYDPNGVLSVTASVTDNGSPVTLTKSGPGAVVFWIGGQQSGGTIINQGTLAAWTGIGGSQPASGAWLTFAGNGTLQYFTPGGLLPPSSVTISQKKISINAGKTGTIDDLVSGIGRMFGANSTIMGAGSIAFTDSFGVNNAVFQLDNQIANSYAGTTTVLGMVLRLDYTSTFGTAGVDNSNLNRLNPNNTLYLGGVLSLLPNTSATYGEATVQTLSSNLSLIAGTASAIGTATSPALPGTTFNLTGPTGGSDSKRGEHVGLCADRRHCGAARRQRHLEFQHRHDWRLGNLRWRHHRQPDRVRGHRLGRPRRQRQRRGVDCGWRKLFRRYVERRQQHRHYHVERQPVRGRHQQPAIQQPDRHQRQPAQPNRDPGVRHEHDHQRRCPGHQQLQ